MVSAPMVALVHEGTTMIVGTAEAGRARKVMRRIMFIKLGEVVEGTAWNAFLSNVATYQGLPGGPALQKTTVLDKLFLPQPLGSVGLLGMHH